MDPMEYIVPNRKRLPYGMMNFAVIRREDYYYVDKTRFIPMIEQADRFFFFIRPRRFGKSLTLNVLQHYYDVRTRDKFNDLFGNLYIGKHPTANRNSYLVLYLNFSGITGELNDYRKGLDAHCSITFMNFCKIYADLLPPETLEELRQVNGAVEQLDYLYQACERAGQKMYLFIDEYDHFTNAILSDAKSLHRYTDETHGEGYLRAFFNKVKAGTYSSIERCFITGVSPVTMDDLTSGFNIGTNYSLTPQFNQMMGFTEEEVREMLTYYSTNSPFRHTVDELIEIMKPWYDNYCFAMKALKEPSMYNSDMVLYFMNHYMLNEDIPDNMLDANIRTDYNKLRHLIHVDKTFGENASVVQEIVEKGSTTGIIANSFPAEDIIKPENFKSLLYYYGMLTISGMEMGEPILSVPNWAVREQLYGYMADIYKDSADLYLETDKLVDRMKRMAYKGEWENCFTYIADRLNAQSSVRDFIEGEAYVKTFILAYLGLTHYYIARPEYESNKGYADIFLQPRLLQLPDMVYSYCIEVKYAKRDASDTEIEKLLSNAKIQLKQYAASEWIHQDKGTTELKSIALVFQGWKLVRVEEV